jgi:hypothetical protein
MHSFSYDEGSALLTIVQQGYWSMADFRDYERDFLTWHERIRKRRKNYRVLADCRDYPVQSAEIGEAFGALFNTLMAQNDAPYAIVVASMLNKLQARRALPFANIQLFSDLREAQDWLFVGDNGGTTPTPSAGTA